jgi:hypothetical protein
MGKARCAFYEVIRLVTPPDKATHVVVSASTATSRPTLSPMLKMFSLRFLELRFALLE